MSIYANNSDQSRDSEDIRAFGQNRDVRKVLHPCRSSAGKQFISFTLDSINIFSSQRKDADTTLKNRIPIFIEVKEFQPEFVFNWQIFAQQLQQTTEAAPAEAKAAAKVALESLMKSITGVFKQSDDRLVKNFIDDVVKDPNTTREYILNDPLRQLRSIFSGQYIAEYQLPYKGDVYMEANGRDGWEMMASDRAPILAKARTFFRNEMPVDFQIIPEWKTPFMVNTSPKIQTDFVLINNNFGNLVKNFKFLHSFISGAFWIQLGTRYKSSNIYNVHFPGFFEYPFCTMSVTATNYGVLRELYDQSMLQRFVNSFPGLKLPSDSSIKFPDGYKVSVTFEPLFQNNFNVYLNYLINSDRGKIQLGQRISKVQELDLPETFFSP